METGMIHFENYRWEDHVPRKGGWKFNLAVGALAFGLIAAAMPDNAGQRAAAISAAAKPAATVNLSALEAERRMEPAAFTGTNGAWVQCQDSYADS
jgi:hypothetical protein